MIEEELVKIAQNTALLRSFLVCYANRIEDAVQAGGRATPTFGKIALYFIPAEIGI